MLPYARLQGFQADPTLPCECVVQGDECTQQASTTAAPELSDQQAKWGAHVRLLASGAAAAAAADAAAARRPATRSVGDGALSFAASAVSA